MKKRFDLKMLENADKDTIDALSGKYSAVSESETENIFQRIIKNSGTADDALRVNGVEIYHRTVWRKLLTAASALVIMVGAAAGGAYIYRHFGVETVDVPTDTAEETTAEEHIEEVTSAPDETEEDEKADFMELQLHEAPLYAETYEDAKAIIEEHTMLISWVDRHNYRIDVKHYAELLQRDDYDINSLEAKSFIYHMLRNSFLYFDSAVGTLSWYNSYEGSHFYPSAEFQINLQDQEGYSKCINDNNDVYLEFFAYDDKIITKENFGEVYQEETCSKAEMIRFPEDNYRYIEIAPPDHGLNECPSCSINCAWSKVHDQLMPEELSLAFLDNFDNWQIKCISEYLGRKAVELSCVYNDGSELKMTVDVYTGIMLELDIENRETGFVDKRAVTSLQVDVPVERVEFDPSRLTKRE